MTSKLNETAVGPHVYRKGAPPHPYMTHPTTTTPHPPQVHFGHKGAFFHGVYLLTTITKALYQSSE